jgi:hypothetical protein
VAYRMLAEDHSSPGPVSMRDKCVPMGPAFIESGCNNWRTLSLKPPWDFSIYACFGKVRRGGGFYRSAC